MAVTTDHSAVLWLCMTPFGRPVVHDEDQVIVARCDLGLVEAGPPDQVLVADGEARSVGRVADVDPARDLSAIGTSSVQLSDDLAECAAEDEGLSSAVGEDERELIRDEPPIEGDDDAADLGRAEEELDEFRAVHQECRNPVALPDPAVDERIGRSVAAVVQLRICEPRPAGEVDHGLGVRVELRPLGDEQSDVVLHFDLRVPLHF